MIRLGLMALLLTASPVRIADAQWGGGHSETPETKDRLSPESMKALVAQPMDIVRKSGLTFGEKSFEALIAATIKKNGKGSVEEADLLTSFGVELYLAGLDSDDEKLRRAALIYLERAAGAARTAFGPRHPEVALALNSYADAALNFDDPALRPLAEKALAEALSIRKEKLGDDNAETASTEARLAELRDPKGRDRDPLVAAATVLAGTAENASVPPSATPAAKVSPRLWKPALAYTPIVDDFISDVGKIEEDNDSISREVAKKYRLTTAMLNEGVELLRAAEDDAYDDKRKAGLRIRALDWLRTSNRAPIALAVAGAVLDHLQEDGCSPADLDLLLAETRDPQTDLWTAASTCTSAAAFAHAITLGGPDTPALLYVSANWLGNDRATKLATADMLLGPEYLARVDEPGRTAVAADLLQEKLGDLLEQGLLSEAIAAADRVDPAILRMALERVRGELRATIGGATVKNGFWANSSLAEEYASALALAGREPEARTILDFVAAPETRKAARACLEAANDGCTGERGTGVTVGALALDQLLGDQKADPYVLLEAAVGETVFAQPAMVEVMCRLLNQADELNECAALRKMAQPDSGEAPDKDQQLLASVFRRAGGPAFEAARARYAAILPVPDKRANTEWSRTVVDPAPVPFKEYSIKAKLQGKSAGAQSREVIASLPKGFELVRRERSGNRVVAISLSTRFDPNGEVTSGGYWVHVSDDAGKSWGQPLYTGLAQHFPYVVPTTSQLPLIAGDHLNLEVQEALIDTSSISYPPVGTKIRRKRTGIYLDIAIADLARDSDGDGLTDIAARHLLLDRASGRSTPFVVGRDKGCTKVDDEVLARLAVLKEVFAIEGHALLETPEKEGIDGGYRRTQPTGKPPIFLKGNPEDWHCVTVDRPMIVYSDADQERLREFSPDFQLIELPAIRWNRARTRGFVNWSTGWAGGTYRITREGGEWKLNPIREWIT